MLKRITVIRSFLGKLLVHIVSVNVILGLTLLLPAAQPQYAAAPEFITETAACSDEGMEFSPDLSDQEADYANDLKIKAVLDAPLISQYPELPRGCEVTSLAMLLQYAGIPVDKITLAGEVEKDFTPYQVKNGRIYFGNPYFGFVGNMYSLSEPGYGVYHRPIKRLMEWYLPDQTIDLTGCDFEDVLSFISQGTPVWVIVNTHYAKLDPKEFQTWHTPYGPLQITYKEHSVLITGNDREHVYFNDPRTAEKNKKVSRESFEAAWVQMGRQAITYIQRDSI
ncbi:MAG: peptidase C39 [Firmicutes bacterium HGW-Firmicutes-13]|nr:MAG: peptidase C39 [Firmicutes bacterium HGW-Firmicutes-13]